MTESSGNVEMKDIGIVCTTEVIFSKKDMRLLRNGDGGLVRALVFKTVNIKGRVHEKEQLIVPLFQVNNEEVIPRRVAKEPEVASAFFLEEMARKCVSSHYDQFPTWSSCYVYKCIDDVNKQYGVFVSGKEWKLDPGTDESVFRNIPKSNTVTRCVSKSHFWTELEEHGCDPKRFQMAFRSESGLVGLRCVVCGQEFFMSNSGTNVKYASGSMFLMESLY